MVVGAFVIVGAWLLVTAIIWVPLGHLMFGNPWGGLIFPIVLPILVFARMR